MKRKTEDELKAEIKEKLGISGIEQLLETHIAESSDEDYPPREILTEMLADLKHPSFYEIYQGFFEMGTEDAVSDLSPGTRVNVLDDISVALGYALGLGKRYAPQVVERLDAPHPSLKKETIEGITTYWSMFFSILTEVNNRRLGNVGVVMDSLGDFSYSELWNLYYNTIFYGRGSPGEIELNLPALEKAVKSLSNKQKSTEAKERLKLQAQFEGELGKLAAEWSKTQPWILELDPKLKRIRDFYTGEGQEAGELRYSTGQLGEIFDFSSSQELSPAEFKAYLSLLPALKDLPKEVEWRELLKLLKKVRNRVEREWKISPPIDHRWEDPVEYQELKPALGEAFNVSSVCRSDYLTPENMTSMDFKLLSENSLFAFFHQLLESEPGGKEEIANEHFIDKNNCLSTLYFLDRTRIMPLSRFKQMRKELVDEDDLNRGVFYRYVVDLSYVFSFGADANKDIFERVCLSPSMELGERLLNSLSSLRQYWMKKTAAGTEGYKGILEYLGSTALRVRNLSHEASTETDKAKQREEEIASVFVDKFAQAVTKSKTLEMLLLSEREGTAQALSHLSELEAPAEEKIGAMKTFFSATEEFYQLLQSACDPEIILFEYRAWLKEGTKTASFQQWQEHFRRDSAYVREVFLRYNAPAAFEEQQEVVRMLAHMVSGRELPFGAINVPDLALEIPFGGGKTVLLPKEINLYQSKRDNAKVYNLLTLLYAGMHAYGGFEVDAETLNRLGREKSEEKKPGRKSKVEKEKNAPSAITSFSDYFRLFSNYELAESIFIAAEQMRLFSHLQRDFPGIAEGITSYFTTRKKAQERAKFAHPAHQQVFEAYCGAMMGEEQPAPIATPSTSDIQKQLCPSREKPTVMSSLELVKPVYEKLDKFYRKNKNSIPKQEKTSLDSRVVEELMQEMLKRGAQAVWESMVLKEHGYRYPEQLQGEVSVATVYEEIVPARKNDLLRRLLKGKEEQVAQMGRQLEQLVPEDPYLQRKRMQGVLDRRAFLRYQRDLAQGKVPDPHIYYKKIIEKRDVATVFALNLGRGVNQTIDGVPLRVVLQQILGSFLEASVQLRDTIGIYGFSGSGRDNVVVYVFKDLEEPLSEEVYYRLGLVGGQNYNRNGAVYRHFTRKFENIEAERKIFVELCPNYVPMDVGYQGNAAVQDSALALNRMKVSGTEPVCICLSRDEASRQNLLNVYGPESHLLTTPAKVLGDLGSAYLQLTGK